jgi:alpha-L-rhamnosidase
MSDKLIFCCIVLIFSTLEGCMTPKNEVTDLTIVFIQNIDPDPVISWKISSPDPGFKQTAYQVIISDNPRDLDRNNGNVWSSGKHYGENQQVPVSVGSKMQRGEPYFAKVLVWDKNDNTTASGKPVRFFVPLNYPDDWKASWITYDYHPGSPLPVFRIRFDAVPGKKIEHARLYISAPGFYEAYLNGGKIGKNVLDPGQTNYEDYTFYTSCDIDPDIIGSENVLGILLGNGWYNQNIVWSERMSYGQPVVICQLVVQYQDGHRQVIGSDESWKWKYGPITYSNIYGGETYDANREVKDWFDYNLSDTSWKNAVISGNHPVQLFEQFAEPVRKMDSLDVVRVINKNDGKYIVDFGQNFSGWVRLSIKGKKGQEVVLRHVEVLDSAGNINPITTGVTATKVIQTARYICRGEGTETWEPRFTYFGFRYVEVEGLEEMPSKEMLKGIVVYSSLPRAGYFRCSEENINMLHKLADWTITGNIHSIPTDCPHREKCGWTGDAHAFAQSLIYNHNAQKFLAKYMFDLRSSGRMEKHETYYGNGFYERYIVMKPRGIPTMIVPGKRTGGIASPDWGTATVQLPWYVYLYYGDVKALEEFYSDMRTWVEYVHSGLKDGIVPHGLGDWCPPQGVRSIDCPVAVSSTAFHILDVSIMKEAAGILGTTSDAEYYSGMLKNLKASFNDKFYDPVNNTYGSQTADVMALDFDIVPEQYKRSVAYSIVDNINNKFNGFVSTGIFGLARIFKVLSENGMEEEAFKLLSKKGKNSFAYMWDEYEATTLWEVLPVFDYNERSHSHPMQAGYDGWFYSGIAGINPVPGSPGFKKIIFKPFLTQLMDSAGASYESGYGTIRSFWHNKDGRFIWKITIPANSEGKFYAPVYGKKVSVKLNGRKIDIPGNHNEDFILLGDYLSGDYVLEINQTE